MSETLKDIKKRKQKRAEVRAERAISDYEVNRKKDFHEADQITEPEKTSFPSGREQRVEGRKSNRWVVECKSCGARIVKQPSWLLNRMRLFRMGKDVTFLLDFSPYVSQAEMERTFPRCGNCRGTHWKKVRFDQRKESRMMRSVLLQGDFYHPVKLGVPIRAVKLLKSERNV